MNTLLIALALAQESELAEPPRFPADVRPFPNAGRGPLRLASQSPFRLGTALDAPSTLPAGRWETRDTATWSRVWGQTNDYLLSFETLNQTNSFLYGLSDRLQAELGLVSSVRFGGDLDGLVKNFHDNAGISQGGRDTVKEGRYAFHVGDVDVPEESDERVFAGLRYTLSEGGDVLPALAAGLTLSRGDDGLNAGAGLSASKRWGEWVGHVGLDLAWTGQEAFYGLARRTWGASVRAALEWRGFVLQYLGSTGALDGYGDLGEPSHEIALGVKAELVEGSVLEVGVTENILVFDNSPDFGLHAGLSVRF